MLFSAEPDTAKVKKELAKIRKEFGLDKKEEKEPSGDNAFYKFLGELLENIGNVLGKVFSAIGEFVMIIIKFIARIFKPVIAFLLKFGEVFFILFCLLLLLLLTFIIYKIVVAVGNHTGKTIVEESSPVQDLPEYTLKFDQLYKQALEYAGNNNFPQALMMLHKATVRYLLDLNIITSSKEYTNGELRRLILGKNFEMAFCRLAGQSEYIKFKHLAPGQDVYETLHKEFRQNFMESR